MFSLPNDFVFNDRLARKTSVYTCRDNGLAIIKNKSARLADKARKELHKAFGNNFGLPTQK